MMHPNNKNTIRATVPKMYSKKKPTSERVLNVTANPNVRIAAARTPESGSFAQPSAMAANIILKSRCVGNEKVNKMFGSV